MNFSWHIKLWAEKKCAQFVDVGKLNILQNECFLAKIDLDTADNEPLKVWGSSTFQIRNLNLSRLGRGQGAFEGRLPLLGALLKRERAGTCSRVRVLLSTAWPFHFPFFFRLDRWCVSFPAKGRWGSRDEKWIGSVGTHSGHFLLRFAFDFGCFSKREKNTRQHRCSKKNSRGRCIWAQRLQRLKNWAIFKLKTRQRRRPAVVEAWSARL